MNTRLLWVVLTLLGATPAAFTQTSEVAGGLPSMVVKPAAPPVARPFNLHQVRLLGGEFKTAEDTAVEYLLSLEPDRLLAGFLKEAGLPPKAQPYGGWESKTVAGHSLGHYLSACATAWASTGNEQLLGRVNHMVDELADCQRAGKDGFLAAFPGGRKAYAEIAAGDIRSSGFDLNGLWVPNYTLHKLFAGLRDAYRLCGNRKALEVERGLGDFFYKTFSGLSDDQMQKVLDCEHGGMNEVLADLYGDTGETRYLQLSRRFHHKAVLEPLLRGQDILAGKHANTQIPKIIGLASRYELAGDDRDRLTAEFFWDRVVDHHSYVTGDHSNFEHFSPSDELSSQLSPNTTETCNAYNMLKLTEHLFGWNPRAEVMDFYERALLNHIRASQHPDGRVMYYVSLKPGHYKSYQTKFDDFTCCVGSGMENHVKYGEGIYFHGDKDLWVNLFIPSRVTWPETGLSMRQETKWPDSATSTLTIEKAAPVTLHIRHPFWADKLIAKVNGDVISDTTSPASYAVMQREWKAGDTIEVRFPMTLRTEAMPDNPKRIAVFYGPTLLAADLGPVSDPAAEKPGYVPVLLTEDRPVSDWVQPVSLESCVFKTVGVGKPRDVQLVPFHRLHDRRYTVYLDEFSAEGFAKLEAELRAAEQREKELEARTVDVFQPGEMQPERDHNVQGEKTGAVEALDRKLRHAWDGGWFSYEMKIDPSSTNQLLCTWWGGETGDRNFDILVDGNRIASQKLLQNQPGKFWDATYAIPVELTRGKQRVTVKLQAHPGNFAGGLFGSRILRSPN